VNEEEIPEPEDSLIEDNDIRDESQTLAGRFRSAWHPLAINLIRIRDERLFEAWGHEFFKDYVQHELEISIRVAYQIMHVIFVIQDLRPELLENTEADLPSYAVLDLMYRGYRRLNEGDQETLTRMVFDDRAGRPVVFDFIRNHMEHPEVIVDPEEDADDGAQADLINSYQIFRENLLDRIPENVRSEVGEILQSLEDLLSKSDIMLSVEIEDGSEENGTENEDTFK